MLLGVELLFARMLMNINIISWTDRYSFALIYWTCPHHAPNSGPMTGAEPATWDSVHYTFAV
jgi:hypothetical protein